MRLEKIFHGMMLIIREIKLDKQDRPDGTYDLVLYDDDSTTILKTWEVNPSTGRKNKAI